MHSIFRFLSLAVPLALGACSNDVALGGPSTLVRVDAEPPGVNCMDGGVAISTGLDLNGNGYLDSNEITSTQYVCNGTQPVQCDGGNILSGTVAITDDAGLAQLDGVDCVDGDLLITGSTGAELPDLQLSIVTGDIVVAGNAALTSLGGLARLHEIGDTYLVQGNPAITDLSGLAHLDTVRTISIVGNDGLTELHGLDPLTSLAADLRIDNNANLVSLRGLDNLTVSGRNIFIDSNPVLNSLDALAQLRTVVLFQITGNASLAGIGFASLQQVNTRLLVNNNATLAEFSAPALEEIGDITQFDTDGALATIDFPILVSAAPVMFTNDASLSSITAPKLAFTSGDLELINLPLLDTIDFSNLTSIGGELEVSKTPKLASLATFAHTSLLGGGLTVNQANLLTDFTGLDAVVQIEGDMVVTTNMVVSSFTGLGKLKVISGALTIMGNPLLPAATSTAFAGRVTVHGKVTITN